MRCGAALVVALLLIGDCSALELHGLLRLPSWANVGPFSAGPSSAGPASAGTASVRRAPPPCCVKYTPRPLQVGEVWEGQIAKITDFGAFVRMGAEQHMGLAHISAELGFELVLSGRLHALACPMSHRVLSRPLPTQRLHRRTSSPQEI